MSRTNTRFRLSALSAAIIAATSMSVYAQDDVATEEAEQLEEIQVYGIRRSIEKSVDDKRFSTNIKDTINAEDIGKSTDQNIAEALSRVTGVSAQTRDGEGTTITVRGANAQQNNISLNGVQLGATDFSQAVDLSAFSSDILSKIEVVKTPSADHEEGALGANVNLVTIKPLETNPGASVTVQGRWDDLSRENDYKISAAFTEKFLEDTVGVTLSVYDETETVRKDQLKRDNFVVRTAAVASDVDGNVLSDVQGIVPTNTQYELHQNNSERQGVNLGLQWQATETTEVNFNYNWSEQSFENSMHSINTRIGTYGDMVNGVVAGVNESFPKDPSWNDPIADWKVIDPSTNDFVKYVGRNGDGQLNQSISNFKNNNNIFALELTQDIGDSIVIKAGGNYSKAEEIPEHSLWLNLATFARINPWLVVHTSPDEIEPVGFDCTSGVCQSVTGTGNVDYGTVLHPDPNALWDNSSTTMFNPDDLAAQHLGYLSRTVRAVEDTQKSAYFDVDWDVDFAGINRLEFGVKKSSREKYVDNQAGQFNAVGEGVVIINPETGNPLVIVNGLRDIDASYVAEGSFPVENFMKSLGYSRDSITDGWTTVSAQKAFETALGNPNAEFTPNDTETRNAELDNTAAYFKVNFAFLDERLTGDVGMRYVKTTVDTAGYSGVNFHFDPGNLGRVLDPFVLRSLRDDSNPACPAVPFYGTNFNEEARWGRVDGKGYDTLGTADKRDDVALPDAGACYDFYATQGNMAEWWLWRHSDVSTERFYVYGDREYDANGQLVATEDRSQRSFGVTDKHEYTELLPSLNLNYAFNDELIGRFAVSKTMSRPQIDSLRPGFKVVETVWGGNDRNNTISLTNTKLDPLTSNNLDLSLEWYFAEGALLAGGVFYKDMKNFEESETVITYMDDLRELGLDPNAPAYNADDLLLLAGDELSGCMPKRIQGSAEYNEDWIYSDVDADLCAEFKTTRIKNGGGASIKGLELQYTQTYDMLPGLLAGLGTQLNYTYQDSAYDQEVSSIDPSIILPELPVAFTPEHSYNATVFWERNGHQVRLAYQAQSDQLVQRSWEQGARWQAGRGTLDLSAAYAITDSISLTFNAVNLTDEPLRQYYTSRFHVLNGEVYDEGSPLEDGATDGRTTLKYKTGRSYRLGINARF